MIYLHLELNLFLLLKATRTHNNFIPRETQAGEITRKKMYGIRVYIWKSTLMDTNSEATNA
jgi:hypothetical protein